MSNEERSTRDADIEVFFALSRATLIKRAALALTICVSIFLGWYAIERWTSVSCSFTAMSLPFFAAAILLRRSPVGRGFLWMMGRGRSPRTTVIVLGIVTVLLTIFDAVHFVSARR